MLAINYSLNMNDAKALLTLITKTKIKSGIKKTIATQFI